MARLYISQDRMDTWSSENKVEIAGDVMTLVELDRSFAIRPAVRFLRVAGGDDDPHDLLGKVKDEKELAAMGADHVAISVIYVETAYDVENGFVGDPRPAKKSPAPAQPKGRRSG
ncbi:MAG: hypothetical protein MJE77_44220 [Proteobacteria bacterium]|nr:hypothetical protein [Pseudomonadota bacterium]